MHLFRQPFLGFSVAIAVLFVVITQAKTRASPSSLSAPVVGGEDMIPEPNLPIPRLKFGTETVGPNGPETSPIFPDIPGPVSQWTIGQWHQTQIVEPNLMQRNDPSTKDPILGIAEYSFDSSDGDSHFWIYRDSQLNRYVYELYEHNGVMVPDGGANLLLGTKFLPGEEQLSGTVYYQISAKISKASISFDNDEAQTNGAVKAQVLSGFIMQDIDAETGRVYTIFMQIPMATSGSGIDSYQSCQVGKKGNFVFVINQLLPGESMLPFAVDSGPLHDFRYSLTDHLQFILGQTYNCKQPDGTRAPFSFSGDLSNMANWKIKSMYVGLETQNTDHRRASINLLPQGDVEIGLQVAGIDIWRQP